MTPEADSTETFEEALSNPEVSAIKLTGDIQITRPEQIGHKLDIDLNGHTITASVNNALFTVNGGELTLHGDGTISNRKWIASGTNNGTVTVNGGNYVSQNEGFIASGGGSIIFNDGHISCAECGLNAAGNAHVEFNGGLIETSDNMGIATNGSPGRGGNTIVMNGGKIDASIRTSGYEAIGLYIANSDVFVMNDGEIVANGGTGLCMRGGDVTINGGKITATKYSKSGAEVPDGKIADKDTVMYGCAAIIYDEAAGYPERAGMRLNVKGGTITGDEYSVQVLSTEEEPQVFVTGGTLTPAYPAA